MQDKPLSQQELELLALAAQLHAERGMFDRDLLSVQAKGQGLEFARPLKSLKERGLVEEIERRPFFLMRLFRAQPVLVLRPSEAGLAALSAAAPRAADPAESRPAPTPEPAAAPVAEAKPDPTPAPVAPPPQASPASPPSPKPPAPAHKDTAPSATAPAGSPPKATEPKHTTAFADDDDMALDGDTVPLASALDPETVDELREMVAGLGMELTFAGEALIGSLVAQGKPLGDALSRMLLISFAHAVREDEATGGTLAALGLRDYVVEVMQEMEKLRDAGFIAEARFEEDMRRLWSMFDDRSDRAAIARELLSDGLAGLTPPALLPEDLRPAEDG